MIPVLVNNTQQNPNGLNGLFGRWLKKIVTAALDTVATLVPFFGSLVRDVAQKSMTELTNNYSGDFWNRTAQVNELPMTAQEEAALDSWVATRFNPWYAQITKTANDAFSLPLAQKFQNINSVLISICTVKAYLQQYPSGAATSLSFNAYTNRNTFIFFMLDELENVIKAQVGNTTPMVNIEVLFNSVDLTPLGFATGRMLPGSCLNYATEGIGPVRPQPETVLITTIEGPVKTPIYNDLITQPTTPQPSTQPGTPTGDIVEQGQNFVKKNWLWLAIAGFVGYKILK